MWYITAETGKPITGHSAEPYAGSIEISDETMAYINLHGTWLWDGVTVVEPVVVEPVPPTSEEIAKSKQQLVDSISAACKQYIEHQVNAALQVEIYPQYLVADPHPMVVATVNWVKSGYMTAEVRKSQVLAGIADNAAELCDFSSLGQKPYTVYQLYAAGIVRM